MKVRKFRKAEEEIPGSFLITILSSTESVILNSIQVFHAILL